LQHRLLDQSCSGLWGERPVSQAGVFTSFVMYLAFIKQIFFSMKYCFFSFLLTGLFLWSAPKAQAQFVGSDFDHEIGVHAGFTSGIGLSYRYWPGTFGLQTTFLPIFGQENKFISFGVTGLAMLKDNSNVDLFLYLGNHWLFTNDDPTQWNVGLGPGVEIEMGNDFVFDIMVGYALYDLNESLRSSVTGEVGVYYRF